MSTQIETGSACRSCGNSELPDAICSHCGGYGIRTGVDGDPIDCHACGNSGTQWPPVCRGCGKYRSMKGWS